MFQRIARRHGDSPDEPDATDTTGGDDAVTDAPAAGETPAPADAPPVDASTPSAPPAGEQPTERIPAVDLPTADAQPAGEQATALQPAVPAAPAPAAPAAGTPAPADGAPAAEAPVAAAPRRPGFRARGRMRRRLRYLRKLRDLQVRDLGGLVFDLRRFERKRDDLVAQKIDHIRACDDELRALEQVLDERRDLRDVREPGIGGTCPRCFAVFGSADRFCANCGVAFGGAVQGPAQVAAPPAPAAPVAPPAPSAPVAAPAAPAAPATPPPAPGSPTGPQQ